MVQLKKIQIVVDQKLSNYEEIPVFCLELVCNLEDVG